MRERIAEIRKFINSQKLYMWLVIFIIMINALAMFMDMVEKPVPEEKSTFFPSAIEVAKRNFDLENKLMENKNLATLAILATSVTAICILIGLTLNVVILILRISKTELISRSLRPPQVNWTMWDVAKVVILFLFFGYMLTIIETILATVFPSVKTQEAMRSMVNTTILDILGLSFVFYFAIACYGQKLTDLGVSFKNFFKNVFYGLAGYIAAVPLLILVLLTIAWIAGAFKYQPPPQPVLELFVEEKKMPALVYMTFFVGALGPIAEEIFFRGFMYNAIKKKMGLFWGLVLSSLLFAFLHAHLVGFLPIMILGLLLAYLYEKTGSLVASVTVHIIHNSVMIFFVFLMKELYF